MLKENAVQIELPDVVRYRNRVMQSGTHGFEAGIRSASLLQRTGSSKGFVTILRFFTGLRCVKCDDVFFISRTSDEYIPVTRRTTIYSNPACEGTPKLEIFRGARGRDTLSGDLQILLPIRRKVPTIPANVFTTASRTWKMSRAMFCCRERVARVE